MMDKVGDIIRPEDGYDYDEPMVIVRIERFKHCPEMRSISSYPLRTIRSYVAERSREIKILKEKFGATSR